MKGQSSMELFVTLGIVLAFTVPVLLLLLSINSVSYENTAKAQAEASTRTLSEATDFVWAQGSGAKRVVVLNLPTSTKSINATNHEIVITIKTSAGDFQAASPTVAVVNYQQVFDSQHEKSGLLPITLENINNQIVQLTIKSDLNNKIG